jgi:large subunit ribosomal protein L35
VYLPTFAPPKGITGNCDYCPPGPLRVLPVQKRRQGIILKRIKMPKVKTNSSAKKRFKVTATGKITHQKSFKRHILTKKSKKRKRNMRIDGTVAKSHVDFVKRLLRLK